MKVIEVKDMTKTFNGRKVLKDVSFDVEKGGIFGYLGPNGAGKTTTMRIILGLLKPTFGEALVFGEDLGRCDESSGEKWEFFWKMMVYTTDYQRMRILITTHSSTESQTARSGGGELMNFLNL